MDDRFCGFLRLDYVTPDVPTVSTTYTQRFAEYYLRLGVPCRVADNTLWLEQNRMVYAVGPASRSYVRSPSQARQLLADFPNAILVRTTDGFHSDASSWYAVVCRSFMDLGQYNSKKRSQIRKGLRDCVVEQVDARYVADHGYDVYSAAAARYAGGATPALKSKETFRQRLLAAADFSDVIDLWAVHHEGTLAAYAQVHRFDNTEANYSSMTFDPAYFKFYSSYALIYRMNEYYLRERCMEYVNDGFRALLHPTELQQLLIGKFGFERAFTHLNLYYTSHVAWVMSCPAIFRNMLGRMSRQFAALNALHEARTS